MLHWFFRTIRNCKSTIWGIIVLLSVKQGVFQKHCVYFEVSVASAWSKFWVCTFPVWGSSNITAVKGNLLRLEQYDFERHMERLHLRFQSLRECSKYDIRRECRTTTELSFQKCVFMDDDWLLMTDCVSHLSCLSYLGLAECKFGDCGLRHLILLSRRALILLIKDARLVMPWSSNQQLASPKYDKEVTLLIHLPSRHNNDSKWLWRD